MIRRILIVLLIIILVGCDLKRNYRDNGNVAFVYREKLFEIEGKYLSEYPKDQYYILFDSIPIKKSDVTKIVVEFSSEIDDEIFIQEEEYYEEEDYYDEYYFFIEGKESIKITDKFIRDNPKFFK
ncbi:hypothetical protein [uncultured Lacinutrix sp.]|uniref:hypothetical protein n=1 Tax=uncultured Lacinutrix sp. TaxID=574032 RepID=UPI0026273EF6|nr:hypothetical protein [uncultured Lacinutrix sp.]